jgi:hypothetical protein
VGSQELLRAQRAGAEILHNGAPVVHRPRRPGDREPWLWTDGRTQHRYPASACQAYTPNDEERS